MDEQPSPVQGDAAPMGSPPPPPLRPEPVPASVGAWPQRPTAARVPPARTTGKGRGAFTFALVFGVLLLFSVFLNLILIVVAALGAAAGQSGHHGRSGLQVEVVEDGPSQASIAVIPVNGVISDMAGEGMFGSRPSMVEEVRSQLRAAADDPEVKAVVLAIDSPGGGVTASDVLYNEVCKLTDAGKKVVTHMGDLCASGGYYVAVASDHIVASPTAITGSIGVIMSHLDLRGLLTLVGVRMDPIKSGPFKDIGSPAREMTEAERALLQGVIDQMYARFLKLVSEGRGGHGPIPKDAAQAEAVIKPLADGRIYTGAAAVANGLADSEGYLEDAYAEAASLAGLKEYRVIRYRRAMGLAELLGARRNGGQQVVIDAGRLMEDQARFEYRWRP